MKYFVCIIFLHLTWVVNAQFSGELPDNSWLLKVSIGATDYAISDIGKTLINPAFYLDDSYLATSHRRNGGVIGLNMYYRFYESYFAIEPGIEYEFPMPYRWDGTEANSDFSYEEVPPNDLKYKLWLNYHYLNLVPYMKVYLTDIIKLKGVYLGAGVKGSFNISGDKMIYRSNEPWLDLTVQENLRQTFASVSSFGCALGGGFDLSDDVPLNLDFKWNLGITDIMETGANNYAFREFINKRSSYQLTVGYYFEVVTRGY